MGGWNSGRSGGRPTADSSFRIDIAWMIRTARAAEGALISGSLSWQCGAHNPTGSIDYIADMTGGGDGTLTLHYTRSAGGDKESVTQVIPLVFTVPNYGGKRWWMICPFRAIRVGKLYMPKGGDRFASRKVWRLGYHCQRISRQDTALERLFRLQQSLGGERGIGLGLARPKGMWQRTYNRHVERYAALNSESSRAMMAMVNRGGRIG